MKRWIWLVLLCAAPAFAQANKIPSPRPTSQVVDEWVSNTELLVVPAAEAMPEAKFDFVPSGGEFRGVRSFRAQVTHLAAANYQLAAAVLRESPPIGTHDETAPDSIQTKAQVVEYLKGSFAVLHRAALTLDGPGGGSITAAGPKKEPLWLLFDAIAHSSNHYGQIVEYLRMNGIVPPASR